MPVCYIPRPYRQSFDISESLRCIWTRILHAKLPSFLACACASACCARLWLRKLKQDGDVVAVV
jgi:hypothetical protein